MAEIGAMSRDIPYEARVLVKRMRNDPKVNLAKHWKVVTILIGPNDFCLDFCYQSMPNLSPENHRRELIETLRVLRDNLPRTIINLVTPPSKYEARMSGSFLFVMSVAECIRFNSRSKFCLFIDLCIFPSHFYSTDMRIIYNMRGKPSKCTITNHFECPCVFGLRYDYIREHYFSIMDRWQEIVREVADMTEFTGRNDFTVINQPFLENVQFPRLPNGNHDFTYMSVDCFHLSQKGYAIASNALWNNMLQPYGNKSTSWQREFREFKCPTAEHPYIFTKQNSFYDSAEDEEVFDPRGNGDFDLDVKIGTEHDGGFEPTKVGSVKTGGRLAGNVNSGSRTQEHGDFDAIHFEPEKSVDFSGHGDDDFRSKNIGNFDVRENSDFDLTHRGNYNLNVDFGLD